MLNVGIDDEGVTRSLFSKILYQHKMLGGGFFRAALARELEDQLATRAHRVGNSFGVEGVPQWMGDHFSKRRREVLAEMAKKGVTGARAAAAAALASRAKKEDIPPLKEQFENWRNEIAERRSQKRSLEKLKLSKVLGNTPRDHRQLVDKAINQALDNLTRNRAHFVHEDLFRQALYVAPEFGLGPYEILEATLRRVSTHDDICSTNRECDELNELCQQRRLDAGRLGVNRVFIIDERDDGVHEVTVYERDRVVFTKSWLPTSSRLARNRATVRNCSAGSSKSTSLS